MPDLNKKYREQFRRASISVETLLELDKEELNSALKEDGGVASLPDRRYLIKRLELARAEQDADAKMAEAPTPTPTRDEEAAQLPLTSRLSRAASGLTDRLLMRRSARQSESDHMHTQSEQRSSPSSHLETQSVDTEDHSTTAAAPMAEYTENRTASEAAPAAEYSA